MTQTELREILVALHKLGFLAGSLTPDLVMPVLERHVVLATEEAR